MYDRKLLIAGSILPNNAVEHPMRKLSFVFTIGAVLVVGCAAKRQSEGSAVQPVAVQKGNFNGLKFLADIPSLKDVSLKMSEADFLAILHRQNLDYTRGIAAGEMTYSVPVKDGGTVFFMFKDGQCCGIQRTSATVGG